MMMMIGSTARLFPLLVILVPNCKLVSVSPYGTDHCYPFSLTVLTLAIICRYYLSLSSFAIIWSYQPYSYYLLLSIAAIIY